MTTYTAANVALEVLPDMSGFFGDLDARLRAYDPPPIRPRVEPDVDTTDAENDLGPGGSAGGGLVAAATAVGIAVGAALAVGISGAIENERLGDKLAAQLGGSPQYAAQMGAIAGKLYAGAYGDSLEGVQDALRAVLQSGALAEDATDAQIESVTASVLDLSAAFGVDATEAASALGKMLRTGLAPDAQTALDVITRGFQQGVDLEGDFLATIGEYSTQFRALGIDAETATGLMSQGLQAGARDADTVADALKEFALIGASGAPAAAEAFALVGLNAEEMTAKIAGGGPAATEALGQVLEGLRGIEDPALRSQAAVGLFGTKAEDLQGALFALDPATAVASLGQVGGAAADMGQVLSDNAATRIESFRRTVQAGLVDFVGNTVLPPLMTLADVVGGVFSWGPVPELLTFFLVSGGTAAAAIGLVAGATWAWTAASSALGTALAFIAANPVTIMIAAIVGLVAGLIWAYHNVEWFRAGVDAAFRVVADIAIWLWQSIFVPAWEAIAGAVSWAWTNVISPVLSFLWDALRILGAIIFTILVAPFVLAWNILAAIITWAWTNVISPVLGFIGAMFGWLWTNAISPVLGFIGAMFTWLWVNVIAPTGEAIMGALRVVGDVFMWLWTNAVKPALDGIGAVASFIWTNVLRPVFDSMMSGVGSVGDAFGFAVGVIGDVWGRIQGIVRPPVEFVVNAVYNSGIRPAWNFIAGLFDLGLLPELRFARGGIVPGYAPGRDTVPAMLSPGEGVLVPEAVRMLGADTVLALNAAARGKRRNGRRPEGDVGHLGDWRGGHQHFAEGGIVGWLWDTVGAVGGFLGGVVDFVSDPIGAVRRVFEGIGLGGLRGVGQLSEALLRFPMKIVDSAVTFIQDLISDNIGEAGAGHAAALGWARTQHGKPYQWGGGGNPSWDCSGFMAGITNVIRGRAPGRIGTTATMPWQGFVSGAFGPFVVGNSRNTGSGIGHMAGTLLGVNVESAGGGKGVRVGASARGADSGMFTQRYAMTYDEGGFLPPGLNLTYNGTGRPEPVFTAAQHDQLVGAMAGAGRGGDRVVVQAREPFSGSELARLAGEMERRQQWNRRRRP